MLWSKGKQLKDIDGYKRRTQVKRHLINIRGHQCEECKNTQWLTKPITLELEHIDGDNTNKTDKMMDKWGWKAMLINCMNTVYRLYSNQNQKHTKD